MRQGAQGWCTGMTLRDGMGREVQNGEHMHTHGGFMSIYGKTNIVVRSEECIWILESLDLHLFLLLLLFLNLLNCRLITLKYCGFAIH